MVRSIVRLAPLAVVLAVAAPAAAQESVYKRGLKSTVWIFQIMSRDGNRVSYRSGSGSLIDTKQKLILTNYHVVGDKPDATVCFPQFDKQGKLIPERDKYWDARQQIGLQGKVIARDETRDLAIIQLPKDVPLPPGTPALKLATGSPDPGDRVHSIGSPGVSGALFNYTDGAVKSVYQKQWTVTRTNDSPLQLSAKVIETSSGTNKGDSGGPLMNDKVELVGVTQGMSVGKDDTRSVSYFIDVSEVKTLLKASKLKLSNAGAVAADTPAKPDKPAATSGAATVDDSAKKESAAASKLNLAKQLAAGGKPEKAAERLHEIVEQYPGTKAAEEAKALMDKK
jgi:S1-C subfamily serine protease